MPLTLFKWIAPWSYSFAQAFPDLINYYLYETNWTRRLMALFKADFFFTEWYGISIKSNVMPIDWSLLQKKYVWIQEKNNDVLFLLCKAWNGAWRRTDEFMLLLSESNDFYKAYIMNNRFYLEKGTGGEVWYKNGNCSQWGSNIDSLSLPPYQEWK